MRSELEPLIEAAMPFPSPTDAPPKEPAYRNRFPIEIFETPDEMNQPPALLVS